MKSILSAVGIEPTNHCNFHCKMCWSQNPHLYPKRSRGYMSWTLFKKVADELAEYQVFNNKMVKVCLNYGGESILHPRYTEMIHYLAEKDCFEIRAITNGTLLTDQIINEFFEYQIKVSISIHNNPETEKAYEKIARLTGKVELDGLIVDCEFEKKELICQIDRWTKILDEIRVYPVRTEDLKDTSSQKINRPKCKQPSYYMGILWNGDTYPCCELLSTDFKGMGNVAETSVTEVWNGKKYQLLRQEQLPDAPCQHCELW